MKKRVCLLGLIVTGVLVSACVQESRPPNVREPVHLYSPAAKPFPMVTEESRVAGTAATVYPLSHARVGKNKPTYQVEPVYTKPRANMPMSKNIAVGGFNQMIVSGPVSLTADDRQPPDQLFVSGTVETLKHFSANIQRGVLRIDSSEPVSVSLHLPRQSQKLTLEGNSKATLRGDLVLSRIDMSGNATMHAYWVDSSNLHIVAGNNTKIFLAGVVTDLDIVASGDAEIDAKYLRADNAFVRTANDADVGLTVNRSLSTLSTDNSTIYYYHDSRVGLHYLNNQGTALRMKGVPPPIQQYYPSQYYR